MISLRLRLLLASVLVLAFFVLVTGFALQRANQQSALQAQQERMQGLVYALLGAIEVEGGTFMLNEFEVPEPRLATPGSGLVAVVADENNRILWESTSSLGEDLSPLATSPGAWRFIDDSAGGNLFHLAFGFRWLAGNESVRYTISVSESADAFRKKQKTYQRQLLLWLLFPAILLLLVQVLILAWTMRPLRRLAKEVSEIEAGDDERIDGAYPRELHGLQGALNTLLFQEGERQKKYRQSLDDLAHSLKTPLSVITNIVEGKASPQDGIETVAEQARRMEQIVSRQLKRASARSRPLLLPPTAVEPIALSVFRSLQKVYHDRGLDFVSDVDGSCLARIDESDLFELLGNLLDNACKWAKGKVTLSVTCGEGKTVITIDDDGPGFPDDAGKILERGVREDSGISGQGLGLAMCAEMVRSAGGTMEIAPETAGRSTVLITLQS